MNNIYNKRKKEINIHLVSDSTGETIENTVSATISQFPDVNRKVPFGAGATLSYSHIDLQVKNETNHHFKIKLWLDKTHLNGELLSIDKMENQYSIEERNHIIKQQIWGGYSRHNQIFQLIKKENKIIQEKIIVENHAIMMYTPFIENKK